MDRIYYDSDCGLCHAAVRFVLRRDRAGGRFRFAPLRGLTFAIEIPAEVADSLPDSIVVQRATGDLLVKSDAAIFILETCGGAWLRLGRLLKLIPRWLRDAIYDSVAGHRSWLLARPSDSCPVLDSVERQRFDP